MKLREHIHWYTGVLLLILGVYACGGLLWAVIRPKYQATITDAEGALELGAAINVEFAGFMWFVILTTALALILTDAILANRLWLRGWLGATTPELIGVAPFLWAGVCMWFGALVFVALGEVATVVIFNIPTQESDFLPGEVITYVPRLDAGPTGYLMAPFVSFLYYWTAILVEPRSHNPTAAQVVTEASS